MAWESTGKPTCAVFRDGSDPFPCRVLVVASKLLLLSSSTQRGNFHLWLIGKQHVWSSVFQSLLIWSESLPDSLKRGPTRGSLRPDPDKAIRGRLRKNKDLLVKTEQKALHVSRNKTYVTPLCLVSMDTLLEIFPLHPSPTHSPRLLGVLVANGERRTWFRRGIRWETTVEEETGKGTEIHLCFWRCGYTHTHVNTHTHGFQILQIILLQ